jgi:lysophospholipase L1-like esterase
MYPPQPGRHTEPHPVARAAAVGFGLLGSLLGAAVVLLRTASVPAAIVTGLGLFALAAYAAIWASRRASRAIALGLTILVIATAGWLAGQALALYRAFSYTAGPADPANPVTLEEAESKIAAVENEGAFRIELSEGEIEAVIQHGLSTAESPLARVAVDIVDADPQGILQFHGEFKNGDLEIDWAVTARLAAGAVQVELIDLDVGSLSVSGLAAGAIEDLVESLADLNTVLARNRADVQSIVIGGDRLLITGTQGGGDVLTSASLLDALEAQATAAATVVAPPPEILGWGIVDGMTTSGSVYYVALGDSLAANVGVPSARQGYVSRVHRHLELMDEASYGLRNFGVAGETSGTMIRSGQLEAALDFIAATPVAYVTIDIGANDLLGHLGSTDCAESLDAPRCVERITSAFTAYETNLREIFTRLRASAPDATIVFLTAYNPFSLGFGATIAFEAQSDATVDAFNDIAARLAREHDILIADGYTPMRGTTAATTHMIDDPPDIHPLAIGYEVLAIAILVTLGWEGTI